MCNNNRNLPFLLKCPWFLVANDEIGGVFAQVVGTKMCVTKRDWALCAGIIVNKVKSEIKEFVLGLDLLEQMTGKPLYAVPFVEDMDSPNEEGIDIEKRIAWEKKGHNKSDCQCDTKKSKKGRRGKPSIVVIVSPHTTISNDLCPLEQDNRFHLEWRRKRLPKPYPTTTAILLPGSRLPLLDMKWLQVSFSFKFSSSNFDFVSYRFLFFELISTLSLTIAGYYLSYLENAGFWMG